MSDRRWLLISSAFVLAVAALASVAAAAGAAQPRDFKAVSKLVSQSTEGNDAVFQSRVLTRMGGRVIGSSVNQGVGNGRYAIRFEFDSGSLLARGRIRPAINDPGFSRICGGTETYAGVEGRLYYEDLKPGFSQLLFDFEPLRVQ